MNKNKELEAIKQLFNYAKSSASLCISQAYEDKKIIKSALTRLEKLEKAIELIKDLIDIDFEDGSETNLIIGMRHYVRIPKEIEKDIKEVFGNE